MFEPKFEFGPVTEKPKLDSQPGYESLARVLVDALDQAQFGKGAERHGSRRSGSGFLTFEEQRVMEITHQVGLGFPLGQAMKKIGESQGAGFDPHRARNELYGAIVYLAAAILFIEEESTNGR